MIARNLIRESHAISITHCYILCNHVLVCFGVVGMGDGMKIGKVYLREDQESLDRIFGSLCDKFTKLINHDEAHKVEMGKWLNSESHGNIVLYDSADDQASHRYFKTIIEAHEWLDAELDKQGHGGWLIA